VLENPLNSSIEEGVVVLRGVEQQIEINQIDGFVFDVTVQNFEIVAVIKRAHASERLEKEFRDDEKTDRNLLSGRSAVQGELLLRRVH